jgi:hypothetical protein
MRLGIRALDQTITVDPIVVDGQAVGSADAITGTAPPPGKRLLWPWFVAGGALLAAWWYVEQSEGGRNDRPLVGA